MADEGADSPLEQGPTIPVVIEIVLISKQDLESQAVASRSPNPNPLIVTSLVSVNSMWLVNNEQPHGNALIGYDDVFDIIVGAATNERDDKLRACDQNAGHPEIVAMLQSKWWFSHVDLSMGFVSDTNQVVQQLTLTPTCSGKTPNKIVTQYQVSAFLFSPALGAVRNH